jgi:photosystem II stability/assembly factor-like uncharacterized protein
VVGAGGVALRSSDGGTTWRTGQAGLAVEMHGVACAARDLCLAAGTSGAILKSTDGGTSWKKCPQGPAQACPP